MSNHIVSYSIAPNGTIVSNSITPNANIVSNSSPMAISNRIVSHSIVSNGNIVSNSIAPIGNVVSRNFVDNLNILLSKHISYSFSSAIIRHVNGIDFTLHSNLYFDVQRWIN